MFINRSHAPGLASASGLHLTDQTAASAVHHQTQSVSAAGMQLLIGDLAGKVDSWKAKAESSTPGSRLTAAGQERYHNSKSMLEHMQQGLKHPSAQCFAHYANNELAGLMVMLAGKSTAGNKSALPAIHTVVTCPGTSRAGRHLAVRAAGLSDDFGHNGKVFLDAWDGDAVGAFMKMGFHRLPSDDEDENLMMLDPAASDLWEKEAGYWTMKGLTE